MDEERRPIRKRVRTIVLLVSVITLTLASAVSMYSMFTIRDTSSEALRFQLATNLSNTIADKAGLADAQFGKFAEYINTFVAYIHELYVNPQGIRMARGYSPGSDGARERRYYVENENTVFLFCMVEDERYYDLRDCEEMMRKTADALRLQT